MHYVPSQYNCFFDRAGKSHGYNFLYRSIIEIAPAVYDQVRHALSDPSGQLISALPLDCRTALVDADFLVPATRSELAIMKVRYSHQLFSINAVNLTILPTLACNLTCPYCCERKKGGIMTPAVADAVAQWIKRAFTPKRRLHVSWFGGEPLLGKPVIKQLTESLLDICREWRAGYTAGLTTNGYYLDQEVIDNLENWGLRGIQVTFDGDREYHDALRKQHQGGGSFDRIAENVERFCRASHPCYLLLRVNCTDANYASVFELLKRFGPDVRRRAKVFFRWVWPNEVSGCLDLAADGRIRDSYGRLDALYQAANDSGWLTSNPATQSVDGYCEVDSANHFSIDPFGNLYLCTHTFDAAEAVGSVFQPGTGLPDHQVDHYDSWYATNPFGDPECQACRLLPVCWGGCRKARILGGRACIDERQSVELFAEAIVRDHLRGLAGSPTNDAPPPDPACARGDIKVIKAKYVRAL